MSPTDRKEELQLDPKLVPWTRASKSLHAWPWLILVGYLPRAWSFVLHICVVAATLLTFSVMATCCFCGFQNVALERPGDRCWDFLSLVVVLNSIAFVCGDPLGSCGLPVQRIPVWDISPGTYKPVFRADTCLALPGDT